jgi:glycolate oxidase FAD binding subunit
MAAPLTNGPVDDRSRLSAHAVDDLVPTSVVAPRDIAELSAALRDLSDKRQTAIIASNRTKISWGCPPTSYEVALDCTQMESFIEHMPSDLVVRASAGTSVGELQEALAIHGQRLAVDEMVPGTSIGGLVATGLSGPLRFGFGAVRDLLIGITVARPDGVVAKSGGRVVKNVAGYDLGKLYTGSYGTLGVVTEAFFRLHPLPASRLFVSATCVGPDLVERLAAVLGSQSAPSAIEVHRDATGRSISCSILIEGRAAAARQRAASLASLLGTGATVSDTAPAWWGQLPGPLTVKLTSNLGSVAAMLAAVDEISQLRGVSTVTTGSAGVGVVYVGITPRGPDEADMPRDVAALIDAYRIAANRAGGSATVLQGPLEIRRDVDVWGPVRGIELMRRIKDQFDPGHVLSRGRFVGGI